MKRSLYIYNGGRLKRKDNTLQFVNEEGVSRDLPIETIDDIYVMCEMDFNTSLINILSKYGITVHYFNYYDFYVGSFYPKEKLVSGKLLVKQVEFYSDMNKRLEIAKKFVDAAADNIYRNLRYYNSRDKDVKAYMDDINYLRKQIHSATDIKQLMGFEGNIRKTYC